MKLKDYKEIWSKFCFLDESGNLANPKEKFFTIGAINYDLKISTKTTGGFDKNKIEFINFVKENIGANSFIGGFRNRIFNIFVDKDIKQRLPLKFSASDKEKGPSS